MLMLWTAALLQISQLGVGVHAVRTCYICDSWKNDALRPGYSCEFNPPRPMTCRKRAARCSIATDYAADGRFHRWRIWRCWLSLYF